MEAARKKEGLRVVLLTETSLVPSRLLGLSFNRGQSLLAVAHPDTILEEAFQGRCCPGAHWELLDWRKHGDMLY